MTTTDNQPQEQPAESEQNQLGTMEQIVANAILESINSPKSVTVDGQNVQAHSLKDLIDADKHLASKKAAKNPFPNLLICKLIPPGTT